MGEPARVVTIGNFDGVHVGHGRLLSVARDVAGDSGRVTAVVFDAHPRTVLRPDEPAPAVLTTFEQRRELILANGADEVVRLSPTNELLSMAPEAFVARMAAQHAPTWLVEGHDFRFGKGRKGDEHVLRRLGEAHGFGVTVVDEQMVSLSDQHEVRASSTLTRWLIERGRVADAARVLGRPYRMSGVVERGDRRGRTIGFPTANLRTPNALPADGVYAARATLGDGRTFDVALHVGERPVFDDTRRTVEAYVLDWEGPLAEGGEEYGWGLHLDVIAYLRDQMRFSGVDGLVEQIHRDVARSREALARGMKESIA